MMVDVSSAVAPQDDPSPTGAAATEPRLPRKPRLWPAWMLVMLFWSWFAVVNFGLDLVISHTFMLTALAALLTVFLFVLWWLFASRLPWIDRLGLGGLAVVAAAVSAAASRYTLGIDGALFFGLPLMITLWTLWLLASGRLAWHTRRIGTAVVIVALWAIVCCFRSDGIGGDMDYFADVHFRWTPTAEEKYLATRAQSDRSRPALTPMSSEPLILAEGDWPGFRGPLMLGEQSHPPIATDWSQTPPKPLWKRPVGPAWSSVVVVGDRLFTQEQRGEEEATVALDADTGEEIWAHVDAARFWDGQAGAGPRATPTFDDGRLYTYGATGLLNCLEASTGKLLWQRNVAAETGAPKPMWGFSSSPLVVAGRVVVFAGAPEGKGLVAYDALSGEPAWNAPAGQVSYSSAQLATLGGTPQILLLSDTGLLAVDPASGQILWQYDAGGLGMWRVAQPRARHGDQVIIGSEDLGLRLLEVKQVDGAWSVSDVWSTKQMRPAFNDFVTVGDVAYGFDKGLFCALDLNTGKRLWKGGRFGFGQVLLLSPQNVLVVLSEQGEVVLLAANPEKLEELSRIHSLDGKTWNHPVLAHGRLYVRNDKEMAAYEIPAAE